MNPTIDERQGLLVLTIYVKKSPVLVRLVLAFFSLAGFLVPIVMGIVTDYKSLFGAFLATLIFWLTSIFLFRLLLWNSFGKETYFIDGQKILCINDFRLFRSKPVVINYLTSVNIGFSVDKNATLFHPLRSRGEFDRHESNEIKGYLQFSTPEVLNTSCIPITQLDAKLIISKIEESGWMLV